MPVENGSRNSEIDRKGRAFFAFFRRPEFQAKLKASLLRKALKLANVAFLGYIYYNVVVPKGEPSQFAFFGFLLLWVLMGISEDVKQAKADKKDAANGKRPDNIGGVLPKEHPE